MEESGLGMPMRRDEMSNRKTANSAGSELNEHWGEAPSELGRARRPTLTTFPHFLSISHQARGRRRSILPIGRSPFTVRRSPSKAAAGHRSGSNQSTKTQTSDLGSRRDSSSRDPRSMRSRGMPAPPFRRAATRQYHSSWSGGGRREES
jgi:hypothetical protein